MPPPSTDVTAPLPDSLFNDSRDRYALESDGLHGDLDQVIRGLPPIDPDAPALRLSQAEGVRHLVMVGLGILIIALVVELAATLIIRRATIIVPEITGPEAALLQAEGPASRGPYVLLLGDSVMRGGALSRALGPRFGRFALGRRVRERLAGQGGAIAAVDLSMEGALANDYVGLIELLLTHTRKPAAVLMQIDYRVLSPVHDAEQSLSRTWLTQYVRSLSADAVQDYRPPDFLRRPIDEAVQRALLLSSAYVLLRGGLPSLTQESFLALGRQPRSEELDASVLRLLVQRFYGTDRSVIESRTMTDLLGAVDLVARNDVPVLVAFTPASFSFLGPQVNVPAYLSNVAALEGAMRARTTGNRMVRWVNFEGEVSPSMFIDHCHLTAAGNALIAERLDHELRLLLDDLQGH